MTVAPHMKPFDYYDISKIEQPKMNDYMTVYYYDKGELIATVPPGSDYEQIINDPNVKMTKSCVKQQVLDSERYDEVMKEYKNNISKLASELANDLFKEFDIEEHPKRHRCYALAYQFGGEFGPKGVYDAFEKLVTLIVD